MSITIIALRLQTASRPVWNSQLGYAAQLIYDNAGLRRPLGPIQRERNPAYRTYEIVAGTLEPHDVATPIRTELGTLSSRIQGTIEKDYRSCVEGQKSAQDFRAEGLFLPAGRRPEKEA
jgi:hypothetical protein